MAVRVVLSSKLMVGVWTSCLPHIEKRMVLHGLWPEYDDLQANTTRTHGYWPQFCEGPRLIIKCYSIGSTAGLPVECSIPKRDRKILHQDWTNYAPGYPFNTEDASRGWNLGDHEYAKHGTCTNLTSLVYLKRGYTFNETR